MTVRMTRTSASAQRAIGLFILLATLASVAPMAVAQDFVYASPPTAEASQYQADRRTAAKAYSDCLNGALLDSAVVASEARSFCAKAAQNYAPYLPADHASAILDEIATRLASAR